MEVGDGCRLGFVVGILAIFTSVQTCDFVKNGCCIALPSAELKMMTMNRSNVSYPAGKQPDRTGLSLSTCPDSPGVNKLKVIILTNQSKVAQSGSLAEVTLCYKSFDLMSVNQLNEACFRLQTNMDNHNFNSLTCWLHLPESSKNLQIHSMATLSNSKTTEYLYGEHSSDPKTACADACVTADVDLGRLDHVHCQTKLGSNVTDVKELGNNVSYVREIGNNVIYHGPSVHVNLIQFQPSGGVDPIVLNIAEQGDNFTIFSVNCTHSGPGTLEVVYKAGDSYCPDIRAIRIRMHCDSTELPPCFDETASPTTLTVTRTTVADDTDPFHVFVLFGLAVMTSIVVILVFVIFVVQRIRIYKQRQFKRNQEQLVPLRARRSLFDNGEPNQLSVMPRPPRPTSARSQCSNVSWSPSIRSSSNGRPTSSTRNSGNRLSKLQKSFTHVMLDHLGNHSNAVMLLPLPYDTFSRDLTDNLKHVLAIGCGIRSQCCFDTEVHQEYMSNKSSWIDKIINDSNKIVIFVCLQTLTENDISECVIYNLLSHCQITKAPPKCHVVFLHLTDNVRDLDNKYQGLDVHIKHENAYESFLNAILKASGKDTDTDRTVLDNMLKCESSKHFLECIGHS